MTTCLKVSNAWDVLKAMEWYEKPNFLAETGYVDTLSRSRFEGVCVSFHGSLLGSCDRICLSSPFVSLVFSYDPIVFEGLSYDPEDKVLQVSCDETYLSELISKPCG